MPKPETLQDRFSYLVGTTMGQNFLRDSIYDYNMEYIIAGINDVVEKKRLASQWLSQQMGKTRIRSDKITKPMSAAIYSMLKWSGRCVK